MVYAYRVFGLSRWIDRFNWLFCIRNRKKLINWQTPANGWKVDCKLTRFGFAAGRVLRKTRDQYPIRWYPIESIDNKNGSKGCTVLEICIVQVHVSMIGILRCVTVDFSFGGRMWMRIWFGCKIGFVQNLKLYVRSLCTRDERPITSIEHWDYFFFTLRQQQTSTLAKCMCRVKHFLCSLCISRSSAYNNLSKVSRSDLFLVFLHLFIDGLHLKQYPLSINLYPNATIIIISDGHAEWKLCTIVNCMHLGRQKSVAWKHQTHYGVCEHQYIHISSAYKYMHSGFLQREILGRFFVLFWSVEWMAHNILANLFYR